MLAILYKFAAIIHACDIMQVRCDICVNLHILAYILTCSKHIYIIAERLSPSIPLPGYLSHITFYACSYEYPNQMQDKQASRADSKATPIPLPISKNATGKSSAATRSARRRTPPSKRSCPRSTPGPRPSIATSTSFSRTFDAAAAAGAYLSRHDVGGRLR